MRGKPSSWSDIHSVGWRSTITCNDNITGTNVCKYFLFFN
jgi:hypothetical protein